MPDEYQGKHFKKDLPSAVDPFCANCGCRHAPGDHIPRTETLVWGDL